MFSNKFFHNFNGFVQIDAPVCRNFHSVLDTVFGFRLFDNVKYKGENCFIYGRRASGSLDVRKLDRTTVSTGVTYKKLILVSKRKTFLTERRLAHFLPTAKAGGIRASL